MDMITEMLPFLIPLIVVIVTIVGMNFIGPILYFILGKEEE